MTTSALTEEKFDEIYLQTLETVPFCHHETTKCLGIQELGGHHFNDAECLETLVCNRLQTRTALFFDDRIFFKFRQIKRPYIQKHINQYQKCKQIVWHFYFLSFNLYLYEHVMSHCNFTFMENQGKLIIAPYVEL